MIIYNNNDVYKTKYFMYQYNYTNFRILKQKYCKQRGFELIEKAKKIIKTDNEECQRISLSRSKRFIREISLCNDFEYFVTLTVNKEICDRYDVDVCQDHLKHILKNYQLNMKKTYKKDFKYILITEKHKDGAFHFHGLMKGLGELYTNSQGYLSCKYFDDRLGFNSFSKIQDYNKCCNYITKYITQDCVKNSHNQVYMCSRGLKKADKYEILPVSDDIFTFENDFCCIRDVNVEKENKEIICTILQECVDK